MTYVSYELHQLKEEGLSFSNMCHLLIIMVIKGNTRFLYGVMDLVQMDIFEAYAILQYVMIVFAVKIESKVMKL